MNNANPESSDLIVRLAGHGQFKVKKDTVHRLNSIDDKIVELLKSEITDSKTKEGQLQKNLNEILNLITKEGKPLDDKEIVNSDLIIPHPGLSVQEAEKIFKGEGLIPE